MKRLNIFSAILLVVVLTGCTKKFEDMNTNPARLLDLTPAEFPFLFSRAQSSTSYVNWRYQAAQNYYSDLYAQYFSATETYVPNDRYNINMGDLVQHWRVYTDVVPQLKTLLDQTDASSAENALAKVWWVYTFHRITDYYGPIPYFQAGVSAKSVPYDAQDKIYEDFFVKLAEAREVLKANTDKTPFGNYDLVYQGNVSKWIRFVNTLQLRFALRISHANESLAKTEAEEAVAEGVFTDPTEDAYMAKSEVGGDFNGLSAIAVWNEFRMSASMESVLKGYQDPRLPVYFQPSTGTNDYDGLRNGLLAAEQILPENVANNHSNVGTRWVTGAGSNWSSKVAPQNILHAAEAYFLRAEGALKGWNMNGTAKEMYEKGIETSMIQWGITDPVAISDYINSTAVPVAPGDYFNSPAMNDYPVQWSSDETMQWKQLAQQKWLALYPDGMEAWADIRRMKQIQLYPRLHSDNPDLQASDMIRRIPFIDQEKVANGEAVQAATSLLDGPDKASTPVWWDK